MRILISIILIGLITAPAMGFDLGNRPSEYKPSDHVGLNPGTPDGREGGETIETALVIASLPFNDTGNTSDNLDDYDAICPYDNSTSPDVVYSFTPLNNVSVSVDLFGSTYDTKVYILDGEGNVIACNDDFYSDYVSLIEWADLSGGTPYFIVVDGYGGDSGDYILNIQEYIPPPPCIIVPGGWLEMEPPLEDGYVDYWNGGCNTDDSYHYNDYIQVLGYAGCGGITDGTFYGKAGWYDDQKDTDWFAIFVGSDGHVTWTLDAEQSVWGFVLDIPDCDSAEIVQDMVAGPCAPATLEVYGYPGTMVNIWVGASEFSPPSGFQGHEFNYRCDFNGLLDFSGVTENVSTTFGQLKSLYR